MSTTDEDLADLTGRRIGDYEMVARIGIGGMGVVYEGKHPLIGKRVAVKFLLPSLSKDRELVARFVAEARAVNAIGHRGIVDIFNFGLMEDGTQYFVMEFLDGRPFDKVILDEAPMPAALAIRYLEEILDALQAAHVAGVIHRDIKPSNIFLVDNKKTRPYIKLLDFGIAKTGAPKSGSTPQTRQSVVIGTPEYIAPEQAQGRAISAATDLYAVGCMAFELLTGKLPFRGENPLDTMFKHVVEPTPRARSYVPDLMPALDELVWKLMQKRPEDRPANSGEVLKTLEVLRGSLTTDFRVSSLSGVPAVPASASARSGAITDPALDRTAQSQPIPQPIQLTNAMPSTGEAMRSVRPSPLPWIVIGGIALLAFGLTIFAITRPPQQTETVAPPPVRVTPPVVADAGAATPDAGGSPAPIVAPVVDAGAPPVATPPSVRRGPSPEKIKARIAALEKKLEQREASRGEKLPNIRAFLKGAREDAARADTDTKRREVWQLLDDVAGQIDR